MKRKKIDNEPKITAAYERISREDDAHGESGSILNQRKLLDSFALANGFENVVHYSDDGYSGVSFDRPAWKRMMEDVEKGRIKTIITKDMSRIGRNYLEVGQYSKLVVSLINEHFRHKAALDADPYLETRAKEDAFLQKVLDTIQTGMASASSSFIAGSLLNLVQTANVQQASGSPAPASDFDDEDVTDEDVDAVFSFLDNF